MEEGGSPPQVRDIHVFVTPAGVPSSSGLPDTRPGNHISLPAHLQHWGIIVGARSDTDGGMCFELYRPDDGVGVLVRSWKQRATDEAANSKVLQFEDILVATTRSNEKILKTALEICDRDLDGRYDLVNGNCQTFVNLLVDRIASDTHTAPYTPRHTMSHKYGDLRSGDNGKGIARPWGVNSIDFTGEKTPTNIRDRMIAAGRYADELRRAYKGSQMTLWVSMEAVAGAFSQDYYRSQNTMMRRPVPLLRDEQGRPITPALFNLPHSADLFSSLTTLRQGKQLSEGGNMSPGSSPTAEATNKVVMVQDEIDEDQPEGDGGVDYDVEVDYDTCVQDLVNAGVEHLLQPSPEPDTKLKDETEDFPEFDNPFC